MNFSIVSERIDLDELRKAALAQTSGAFVMFEGWVRNHHDGRDVLRLEYEVYTPIALREAEVIIQEAHEQFGPIHAVGSHREGVLEIGEIAVAVAVSSAHRDEAFRAGRYIIDEVKHRLPIWKKEYFCDGSIEWVNCRRCAAHGQLGDSSEHHGMGEGGAAR